MDTLLIIIGIVCLITGIAGCILPVLPGPFLSYVSLILLQISSKKPFTTEFLVFSALLIVLVTVLDYVVPVWSTKISGGSKSGVRGSTIGLFAGLFLGPFGIVLGPFAGAVIGELISGKDFNKALKSGFASFIGFITGVVMKLGVSIFFVFHFFKQAFF